MYFFSASGRLQMFHVKDSELETICPLMGGHTSVVRCLEWDHKVSVNECYRLFLFIHPFIAFLSIRLFVR